MKTEQLRSKQDTFIRNFDDSRIRLIDEKLSFFYKQFPKENIIDISMEQYVYGQYHLENYKSFSYWMEKELSDFGRISGSPCSQYGVWFGTHGMDKEVKFRHTKKYGADVDAAFDNIKNLLVELCNIGQTDSYQLIASHPFGNKLKGKILTTYFPDKYISIYADDYLDDILKYFNLDDDKSVYEAPIYKQQRLIAFKNSDEIMKNWTLKLFAMFINDELYKHYYNENTEIEDRVPSFPDIAIIEPTVYSDGIDEGFTGPSPEAVTTHSKEKPDYVKKSQRSTAIGDRGEKIVFEYEKRQLKNNGLKMADNVDWVSRRTDGQGFDILSFELDDFTPKQIEVKSTTRKPGQADFFLSEFERATAKIHQNYYLYIVFDVTSANPTIWKIKQPFHPLRKGIILKPIAYQVFISGIEKV